ncbi:hypothetical protein GF373_12560 [bacterium]|nr:hypothetical protein [bacterium]
MIGFLTPLVTAILICFLSANSVLAQSDQSTDFESVFLKEWLLCGPFPIYPGQDETDVSPEWDSSKEKTAEQEKAFDFNFLQDRGTEAELIPQKNLIHEYKGKQYTWKEYKSESPQIDLWEALGEREHVVCYAFAQFEASSQEEAILRIGSDDACKVYLNGEKVYDFWGGRSVRINEDSVPVTLNKGANTILVKVLNMTMHWGFACQIANPKDMPLSYHLDKAFSISTKSRERSNPDMEGYFYSAVVITSIVIIAGILLVAGIAQILVKMRRR